MIENGFPDVETNEDSFTLTFKKIQADTEFFAEIEGALYQDPEHNELFVVEFNLIEGEISLFNEAVSFLEENY